jgi:hypothetical protein
MHCIVIDDLCVLVYEEFHARCIGMHKSLNGKELMYTFTAGLHMMFCGFLLCTSYALDGFICICIQAYFGAYAYIHSYIV